MPSKHVLAKHLTENEAYFRLHNERVQKNFDTLYDMARKSNQEFLVAKKLGNQHFHCECSDETCSLRVELDTDTYEQIHENRRHFVILPGHSVAAVENIVRRTPSYYVVEKRLDPSEYSPQVHATHVRN